MKQDNKKTGAIGEKAAGEYLKNKGYEILESNFYTRFGEIDIIAKKNGKWIFVEVKTKSGGTFGEPWEMVNQRKLQQVKNMAQVYLTKNGLGEVACRIDVVGVWLDPTSRKASRDAVAKIEHWEDVEEIL